MLKNIKAIIIKDNLTTWIGDEHGHDIGVDSVVVDVVVNVVVDVDVDVVVSDWYTLPYTSPEHVVPAIDVVPAFVIATGKHAVSATHEPTTVMPFVSVYEKTFC